MKEGNFFYEVMIGGAVDAYSLGHIIFGEFQQTVQEVDDTLYLNKLKRVKKTPCQNSMVPLKAERIRSTKHC